MVLVFSRLWSWHSWLLLVLLIRLQDLQTSCGFVLSVTPPNAVRPRPGAISTPPPVPVATVGVSSSENEAVAASGTTANQSGNDSVGKQAAPSTGVEPRSSSVLSEFQHFVERRKTSAPRVVLDLRPWEDFRRRHLKGSTCIPIDELEPRLLELPPPFAQPLSIVGSEKELQTARDLLTKKGWRIDAEIGPNLVIAGTAEEEPAEGWAAEVGSTSLQVWRANDFLEFCMERFLLPSASACHTDDANRQLVLDLGCGNGRDTVYMAQNLPPGTRVVGVDNHSYALKRGAGLAERWLTSGSLPGGGGGGGGGSEEGGIRSHEGADRDLDGGRQGMSGAATSTAEGRTDASGHGSNDEFNPTVVRGRACEWLLTDLRKEGSLDGLRASVIHGHRFKCEQLLPRLRDLLLPGGYFIWSTFLDTGIENSVPPWRPSRMMRPGELAGLFSGDTFEILADEIGELPTRGSAVPANFFACRKLPEDAP